MGRKFDDLMQTKKFRRFNRHIPSRVFLIPMFAFILLNVSTMVIASPFIKENRNTITKYSYDNLLLNEQNAKLLKQINNDNDQYYSDVLYKLLPKDKLVELAKSSWSYTLDINGQGITKDKTQFDAKSSKITIVVVETLNNEKLPIDIARLGTIEAEGNGKLDTAIKLTATKAKCTTETKREEKKLTVTYTYTNVAVGEIITLQLSPSLMKQLKLDNGIIEIFNSSI